jgi:hypothetical protein
MQQPDCTGESAKEGFGKQEMPSTITVTPDITAIYDGSVQGVQFCGVRQVYLSVATIRFSDAVMQ